ncbi:MAG: nucleotidyl transferase AbiEii/AbiGii toxin family protein, partial [Parachlamydiaceae bacterium]
MIDRRGPVSPQGKTIPRIKIDLIADERVVMPPVFSNVYHPYTDEPTGGIQALTYTYEEAFGEKVRALAERTRPRDLYDVINLFRNAAERPAAAVLMNILRLKCEFKDIAVPCLGDLIVHRPDLEASWQNMLGHQLPALLISDGLFSRSATTIIPEN